MIEPIKMSEAIKSEVTSLESSDRVMIVDSAGGLKKVTRNNLVNEYLMATISSQQWVRFGKASTTGSALFEITTNWQTIPGLHLLVDMILHPNNGNYNNAAILSRLSHSASNIIDRIRVVCKPSNPTYLDFHFNADAGHSVFVQVISGRYFSLLPEFEGNAEIPEGYTSREFDMTASSPLIVGGG